MPRKKKEPVIEREVCPICKKPIGMWDAYNECNDPRKGCTSFKIHNTCWVALIMPYLNAKVEAAPKVKIKKSLRRRRK